MTERRPDARIVTDADSAVHDPGGYTVETETLSDGRQIRYYAWPDDHETAAADVMTQNAAGP